jgi:hypothetical protein
MSMREAIRNLQNAKEKGSKESWVTSKDAFKLRVDT